MDLNLYGKVAVVTGGSKGIGYAIAKEFLQEGARVAICARKIEELERAKAELSNLGEVYIEAIDVTDSKSIYDFAEHVYKQYGRMDAWVNNAGNSGYKEGNEYTDDEIDYLYKLVFRAVVHGCQAAFRYMKESGGAIVNIASLGGRCATSGRATIYGPLKSAVINLSNTFAGEFAAWGVRVTSVLPGTIDTGKIVTTTSLENLKRKTENAIMQRLGTVEEIAKPVVFLASDAASFMTATAVEVSGGRAMTLNPSYSYEKRKAEEQGEVLSYSDPRM